MNPDLPPATGLYDPRFEHDACGVSFVADVKGIASRRIVSLGIGGLLGGLASVWRTRRQLAD